MNDRSSIAYAKILLLLSFLLIISCSTTSNRIELQEELASQLGVNIQDFPYQSSFPAGYFYTILTEEMTTDEVQSIVQGYEKVLHCKSYSEIYFYFSSDTNNALRFEIFYDLSGKFVRLETEDTDSRSINTTGCEEGLIQ